MSKRTTICAGIDTGKRKLDIALAAGGERLEADNNSAGHQEVATWLRRHRVKRVGIEASGGYEQEVVAELRRKGFVVIVFQPAQVRAYAIFRLQRAKNDKIDAALIARCTSDAPKIHAPPDPRLAPFAHDLTLLDQITDIVAGHRNRRETCGDPRIRQFWKEEITRLKKLQIGLPTAVAILVRMPEIGRITREQAAALAGLAPYDDDSGEHIGVRHIEGGRKRLRGALYTAALPASFRWNPQLIALYRRLIAAGKKHKRALIACARKLLIFANTVVARGTPWLSQASPA